MNNKLLGTLKQTHDDNVRVARAYADKAVGTTISHDDGTSYEWITPKFALHLAARGEGATVLWWAARLAIHALRQIDVCATPSDYLVFEACLKEFEATEHECQKFPKQADKLRNARLRALGKDGELGEALQRYGGVGKLRQAMAKAGTKLGTVYRFDPEASEILAKLCASELDLFAGGVEIEPDELRATAKIAAIALRRAATSPGSGALFTCDGIDDKRKVKTGDKELAFRRLAHSSWMEKNRDKYQTAREAEDAWCLENKYHENGVVTGKMRKGYTQFVRRYGTEAKHNAHRSTQGKGRILSR